MLAEFLYFTYNVSIAIVKLKVTSYHVFYFVNLLYYLIKSIYLHYYHNLLLLLLLLLLILLLFIVIIIIIIIIIVVVLCDYDYHLISRAIKFLTKR